MDYPATPPCPQGQYRLRVLSTVYRTCRRVDRSYMELAAAVRGGAIGAVRSVHAVFRDHPVPPIEFLKKVLYVKIDNTTEVKIDNRTQVKIDNRTAGEDSMGGISSGLCRHRGVGSGCPAIAKSSSGVTFISLAFRKNHDEGSRAPNVPGAELLQPEPLSREIPFSPQHAGSAVAAAAITPQPFSFGPLGSWRDAGGP